MNNIAVIGSGYWGKNLVRNFDELGALHTICDKNIATLRSFQEKYPEKKFQTSYELVLKNPAIDAVVIATPAETHFELAKKGLLAGKHVFVEKPLALVVSEAETLCEIAFRRNLKLMVGHILLYHPAIVKLKEIISSGELGKINYIYSNRLNLGKFRTEENILWSFAPHDISAILYLLEEMPTQVVAQGGNYLNNDIADVTMSVLSFKSGVKGHIFVSWLHPNKEQKLVVVGDKKMVVFDDTLAEGKLQIHDKGVEWVNRQPVPRKNDAKIVPIESNEPLKAECAHFLECIESDRAPKTDGNNGIQVLKILNACQDSLEHHGTVIDMNGACRSESFFAHETAVIDTACKIGKGSKVWHFSHIMSGAEIGERCNIGQNVVISHGVKIGSNVKIQNNVSIYEGVVLEDDVFCGPSMVFTNVINPRSHISRKHKFKQTLVKKGATIGANATIVCGHTIGRYAFVGAGAVVTKDVPDHALVLGNPATIEGWMCECGHQLNFQGDMTACSECGKEYIKTEEGVRLFEDQGTLHAETSA
ncbi:MAG: Gfo/Idh/MocA family oxidoreductase [Desulfobacterales bacterium]|nr:Gfo/Idh/MocA family oxidoreductase [Desulfobacterales bacterium]